MGRPLALPEGVRSRGLLVLSAAMLLLALVQFARLTVFMVDPARTGFSFYPGSSWETSHSCVSAYYVAARAAGEGQNVYDDTLYSIPGDATAIRTPRTMGPFRIDVYEYPPPFLLLPRALRLLTPDFLPFRFLWFVLNSVVVLVAMWAVARSMGEPAGPRAVLLAPLTLAALPMLSALQKGNVQLVVVALAMLGMLAFERGRHATGGALLAFATAAKLYPGMLVVYLLVRRQWRALAWTAAWGLALTVATVVDVGWQQFREFFVHLPKLLSGEAFPAFRNPGAMAINYSVPGLVFKLKVLGIGDFGFGAAKAVGWAYTVVVIWTTVVAARKPLTRAEQPLVWLAILVLATLRSPFLPAGYAGLPPLWLFTLLVATQAPTTRTLATAVGGWLALNLFLPLDMATPRVLALTSFVPQAATMLVAAVALWRVASPAESRAPDLAEAEAVAI